MNRFKYFDKLIARLTRMGFVKQLLTYFSLFSLLLYLNAPPTLCADAIIFPNDQEQADRVRMACVLAGITVVALGAGVGYIVANSSSSHKCCSSSSSHSCSRSYSCYSHSSHSCSSYSHHSHHSHSSYSDYSNYFTNGLNVVADELLNPQFPMRQQRIYEDSETNQLSGEFIIHPISHGNITLFVQLPNGTKEILGQCNLAEQATLSYGPFNQTGTYSFGLLIDEDIQFSAHLCSLDIRVNGARVENYDFMAAAHEDSMHYFYTLK